MLFRARHGFHRPSAAIGTLVTETLPAPLLGVLAGALALYAIARAILRGHGVESTLAWVLAIVAFPVLGAILYLLVANPSIKRTRRRKQRSAAALRRRLGRAPDVEAEEVGAVARVPEPAGGLVELATRLTGLPASHGNRVELLAESEIAFREIEEAIASARRSVWAEYYIIQNDATGHRFLEALADKAAQGVEVRFLFDAFGSLRIDAKRLAAIRAAGGRTESFLPMNPLRRRWAVHLRNHRKLIVVDGALGFAGGMNIGDEYSGRLGKRRGSRSFRDSHLAIRGPAVADLAWTFAEDWSFATGESLALPERSPPGAGESTVAVVPSGPDQTQNATSYVYFSGIATAQHRICLTSPYFVPDDATLRALTAAAMRGVDVRVLVPGPCDVPLVKSAAQSFYPELVSAGVRVYEFRPAMLHAKTLTVDGAWGIVGSANVDVRSFRLNFELSALVVDARFAAVLEERFLADLARSREIGARALARRTLGERLKLGTTRLLSPLL
ncbi:MAG TPA: cardiolipin synthase [Candidatus Binatia bacterium]|nr:cardiolipin synthase [Candidatus Binatia bacterium]